MATAFRQSAKGGDGRQTVLDARAGVRRAVMPALYVAGRRLQLGPRVDPVVSRLLATVVKVRVHPAHDVVLGTARLCLRNVTDSFVTAAAGGPQPGDTGYKQELTDMATLTHENESLTGVQGSTEVRGGGAPVGHHSVNEKMITDAPKFLAAFGVGDVAHQGDLMVVGIANLPKSAKPRESRQLAVGDTQGSRHILERGDVYDCDPAEVQAAIKAANGCEIDTELIGPVFVSPQAPTENDLTHPEHGNQGYPAGQVCAVVYQQNMDELERRQRSRD